MAHALLQTPDHRVELRCDALNVEPPRSSSEAVTITIQLSQRQVGDCSAGGWKEGEPLVYECVAPGRFRLAAAL
jgi:hypothetical protein